MTIKQAQANYKRYFKADAPADLSIEAITKAIDDAKAEAANQKAIADAKKAADKAEADRIAAEKAAADKVEADRIAAEKAAADKVEADRIAAEKAAAKKPKYKIRFGVIIEGMGKFTKEELASNPDAIEYLVEIGSPAVIKL